MDFPQLPTYLQTTTENTSKPVCPPPAHDLKSGCILFDAAVLFSQRRCSPGQKVNHPKYGLGTVRVATGQTRLVDFEVPFEEINDQGDLECWVETQNIQVVVSELKMES
jgi:hypothetical protein